MSKLSEGAGPAAISECLWRELEDHFGLDPNQAEVDSMSNRSVA